MKATIVHIAVLTTGNHSEICDSINETLRPATLDPEQSSIIDYAFNINGNVPELPNAKDIDIQDDYNEGSFIQLLNKE